MKDRITLKLDKKTLRKLSVTDGITATLALFGACWVSYKLFTVKGLGSEATSVMLLGVSILIITIWTVKFAWTQMRLYHHQLRDGATLYELTPAGITNHRGETQMWSGLQKIYFGPSGVHFSYMTFNRQAAFRMDSAGINPAEFYKACEFIKLHAPKVATEKFDLDKVPRR